MNRFELGEVSFWAKLNPELSITSNPYMHETGGITVSDKEIDSSVQQMKEDGYFKLDSILHKKEATALANAIRNIANIGLPPIFVFVYDEAWQVFNNISLILEPLLDKGYTTNFTGHWAWLIDKDGSGFSEHRDLLTNGNYPDNKPSNLTVWISLTDATPLNGCMYVLPKGLDPNYPNNLAVNEIPNIQDIRSLPAPTGSILGWDARLIHWGGRSSPWAKEERISIAMSFTRADAYIYNENYQENFCGGPQIQPDKSTELLFEDRLNSIGESIWGFRNRVVVLFPDKAEILFDFCKYHAFTDRVKSEAMTEGTKLIMSSKNKIAKKMFQDKEYEKALPLLREVCIFSSEDVDAHYGLCSVLFKLGMREESIIALNNALIIVPDDSPIKNSLIKMQESVLAAQDK